MSRRNTGRRRATSSRSQPTAARGSRRPRAGVAQRREHVLEAERVAHAEADRAQDLVRRRLGDQPRRHAEQALEREAVPRGLPALLRGLHRERCVLRERDEHVELLVGRPAPAHRLVDGEDAEQVAVGVAHRQEERVLGMPAVLAAPRRRVGHVAAVAEPRIPVVGTRGHDVRAAPLELRLEQRLPLVPRAHLPEQDRRAPRRCRGPS